MLFRACATSGWHWAPPPPMCLHYLEVMQVHPDVLTSLTGKWGWCPMPTGSGVRTLGVMHFCHFWVISGMLVSPRSCLNWFCSGGILGLGVQFGFSLRAVWFAALGLNQPFLVCGHPFLIYLVPCVSEGFEVAYIVLLSSISPHSNPIKLQKDDWPIIQTDSTLRFPLDLMP